MPCSHSSKRVTPVWRVGLEPLLRISFSIMSGATGSRRPRSYPLALHGPTLSTAVACSTLLGARDVNEAIKTLARFPGLGDQSDDVRITADKWLHDLYPAAAGEYWGGLEPDRIAECHIGQQAGARSTLLDELLNDASDSQAYRALSILARATTHQQHLGVQLRTLLQERRIRLEPVAITIAIVARNRVLNIDREIPAVYASVSDEDRVQLWSQWIVSPGGLL